MSDVPPSQQPTFSQAFSPTNEQQHLDQQRQQQTTIDNDNSSLSPDDSSLPSYNNTVVAANNRWDSQILPILVRINAPFIGDDQQDELNLDVDDIVIIEQNWDQYWLKGQCDGLRGKLPKFICETIDEQLKYIPWKTILSESHQLFACVASFKAQDIENDISFERGDIIMANKQINEHWCFGKRCYQFKGKLSLDQSPNNHRVAMESEKMGTFPLNHCWLLDQQKVLEICRRASNSVSQDIYQPANEINTESTNRLPPSTSLPMAHHSPHQPPAPSLADTTTAESATTLTSTRSSIMSTAQSSQSTNSGHLATINYPSNLLQPMTSSSPAPSSSTSKKSDKKLEHRSTIILELVQTERDYLSDLRITRDLFYKDRNNAEMLGIDLDEAFGNIDEVIELGEDLLRSLELHNMSKYDHDKCVGRCFIEIIDRFQQVYGDYCKKHDVTIWNKFADKDTKTKYYLKGKLEKLQAITNCYDIPTILIKPVQRLAKYPLLLNELSKATEDSHPDKKDLDEAFKLVTDAAGNINELRNRSGINSVRYHSNKQQRGQTMSMSFSGEHADTNSQTDIKSKAGWLASKFNFHTVKKKTARLSTRITASLGLVSLTRDEEFERHHETFRLVEKTIKSFLKDLTTFVDHFEHFLISLHQASENVAQFYREQSNQRDLELLKQKSKTCMNEHFHEFKRVVDRQVINVISQLLQKFHSPRQLINKRADKLLDFDTKTKKMESSKDVEKRVALREQQVIAKELYESLNRQLIDELPLFNSYVVDIFKNCILVFLKCRRNLITRYSRQATLLLDTPLFMGLSTSSGSISSNLSTSMSDIMDNFHVKYSMRVGELLEQVSLLPVAVFQTSHYVQPVGGSTGSRQSSFSNENNRNSTKENNNASSAINVGANIRRPPRGSSGSAESSCGNDPSDVVTSTYGPEDLYKLTQNYTAVDVFDLNCKKGDIVGVIQRKHPIGHRNKWFVDNGRIKGLVPQKFLTPVEDKVFSGRRQSSYMVSNSGLGSNTGCTNYSADQQQGGSQHRYRKNLEGTASKLVQPPPPQIRLDRPASRTSASSPVTGLVVSVSPSASVLSTSLENINLHSPTNQGSNLIDNNHHDTNISNQNNNNDDKKNNLNREYPSSPVDLLKQPGLIAPTASYSTFESSEAGSSRCTSTDQRPAVSCPAPLTNSTPKRTKGAAITSASHHQHYDTVDNGRPTSVASELSAEFDPLVARPPSMASSSGGAPTAPERHQTGYATSSTSSSIASPFIMELASKLLQQQVYVASWAFKANGPNQLNLSYNQKLKLLKDCDERGNKDWSLVQAHNGQTGYVPSSYIKLFET